MRLFATQSKYADRLAAAVCESLSHFSCSYLCYLFKLVYISACELFIHFFIAVSSTCCSIAVSSTCCFISVFLLLTRLKLRESRRKGEENKNKKVGRGIIWHIPVLLVSSPSHHLYFQLWIGCRNISLLSSNLHKILYEQRDFCIKEGNVNFTYILKNINIYMNVCMHICMYFYLYIGFT